MGVFHLESDRSQSTTSPPTTPIGSRSRRTCGSTTQGSTTAYTRRPERTPAGPRRAAPRGPYRDRSSTTPTAQTCPCRRDRPSPGDPTPSRPVRIDSQAIEGVVWAAGGVPAGTASTSRTDACATRLTESTVLQDVIADQVLTPGHVLAARFEATGPSTTRVAGHRGDPALSSTTTGWRGRSSPSRATLSHRRRHLRRTGQRVPVSPVCRAVPLYRGCSKRCGRPVGEGYVDHEATVRAWFSID